MIPAAFRDELIRLLGRKSILDNSQDLSLYEYDGGVDKARPGIVRVSTGVQASTNEQSLLFIGSPSLGPRRVIPPNSQV